MIRLFACDLDGTLLNERHECDDVIDAAIDSVLKDGRYFTIATGRGYDNVAFIKKHQGAFVICLNGSLCLNDKGDILYQESIDKEVLGELIDHFHQYNIEYMSRDMTYVMTDEEDFIERVLCSSDMREDEREDWLFRYLKAREGHMVYGAKKEDILKDDILKLNWHATNDEEAKALEDYLLKRQDVLANAPCDHRLFEITKAFVNKGKTIKWLARKLRVEDDEVAVYGDGGNDLEMLAMFKHSYAPSDAKEEAKKTAHQIIGPYIEHSVSKHIKETLKEEQ